jgi:hypothetical protein
MDSETELLVARSPIGDNIIGDASLLDYDSNNTAPHEAGNTPVNAPLDAVYCQWASRCSSFSETGQHKHRQHLWQKDISQSPAIGSLEDHTGIEHTFNVHGF